jgi:hypothetical protein
MKIAEPAQLYEQRGAGGRPGHLARYLRQSGISEPIAVLTCAMANDSDWVAQYSVFLDRYIRQGGALEVCAADLGITIEMAKHLVERIRALQREAIGRHFASSSSVLKTPPTLKQEARREQAVAIGKSVINVMRKNPILLRQVVSGYCNAVNRRMRIVLTRQEDARFGRAVIELVKLLNIDGLGIRVIGFRVGDQCSNAADWLQALGLPADTPVHWVNAPNRNSSASTLHCGIDVVHRDHKGRERTSGTFHLVMVLAAVVEIWRLPFIAKRQLAREKDRQPKAAQLQLFDAPSPESCR